MEENRIGTSLVIGEYKEGLHISYNFKTGEWESNVPVSQEQIDLIFPKWIVEAVKKCNR